MRNAIILAAGKGTRMKSLLPEKSKVSYEIMGVPLVNYVLLALKPLNITNTVTVVGFGGEITKKIVEKTSEVVWQHEQLGTGHAVMQANDVLAGKKGSTIILCGDTPLLTSETLSNLFNEHEQNHNQLTVLGAKIDNPQGYGRLIINSNNELVKIVEQKDATSEEAKIDIVNTGVMVFDNELLFKYLKELTPNNKAKEYYLTDLIAIFNNHSHKVGVSIINGEEEMLGTNDRVQLALATSLMRDRINKKWMLAGVSIEDPKSTYIGPFVEIEPDTFIHSNVQLLGNCHIGQRNVIGPNSILQDVSVGNDNNIIMSHIVESQIGSNNEIGPFARLRPGTVIEDHCRVGNFMEVKNTTMHNGAKAGHLSYLGDADIGEKTNIGCGTIIANYDGYNKTHTHIGKDVFVGSGSTIISPVNVGDSSFIAAGSTITNDINEDALAIARNKQVNKEGYSHIIKGRAKAIKERSKK